MGKQQTPPPCIFGKTNRKQLLSSFITSKSSIFLPKQLAASSRTLNHPLIQILPACPCHADTHVVLPQSTAASLLLQNQSGKADKSFCFVFFGGFFGLFFIMFTVCRGLTRPEAAEGGRIRQITFLPGRCGSFNSKKK